MTNTVLSLLPTAIAGQSISKDELVLPLEAALKAIEFFEANNVKVHGWEGWLKMPDGRVGHGTAPQGTGSLEACSTAEAADVCRTTILEADKSWKKEHADAAGTLHFCLSVDV